MCDVCIEMRAYAATHEIPAQDWRVLKLTDRGRTQYYRFHVEGENLNSPPDHPERRFYWSVPNVDNPRFDLSAVAAEAAAAGVQQNFDHHWRELQERHARFNAEKGLVRDV